MLRASQPKVRDRLFRDDDALTREITSYRRAEYTPEKPQSASLAAKSSSGGVGVASGPTIERAAKLAASGALSSKVVGKGDGVPLRQYRQKSPLERYSVHFSVSEMSALAAFLKDCDLAVMVNVTANYDGPTTQGTGVAKFGGVGAYEAARDAHNRFSLVRSKLHPRLWEIAEWLVMEIRHEAYGNAISMEDAGQRVFPAIKDQATRKGIALGLLKGLAWSLEQFYIRGRSAQRRERDSRFEKGTSVRVQERAGAP